MVEHDGLMRVFWPTDIRKSDRPGVVVGWRNSTLDVFVIAILDDVDVSPLLYHIANPLLRQTLTMSRHAKWNLT